MDSPTFVGIDVSKDTLVVAVTGQPRVWSVPNTAPGWRTLTARLRPQPVAGVVLEATSVYHLGVTLALDAAGFPVAIVNPSRTHAYHRATGSRAKTDAHDAWALLRYATQVGPAPTVLPSPRLRELAELQTCRDGLTELLIATQNRARTATVVSAGHHASVIAHLAAERRTLDARMRDLVAADPALEARRQLIASLPGVGMVTSLALLARLPELGLVDARAIASLAGVAPHPQDSGTVRGPRRCTGGRRHVTAALYRMACTAARWDPVVRDHGDRLQARRPFKVAIIACARWLLGILTAMLREGIPWSQTRVAQGHDLPAPA
jgi:transposase